MDAEELLVRYAKGEKNFAGVDLSGMVLTIAYTRELFERYKPEENTWSHGFNLSEINLSEANLEAANLEGINLMRANLSKANLTGANLQFACLNEADFREANMRETILIYARIYQTNLSLAVLEFANLGDARLVETVLRRAKLRGADISTGRCIDVDFSGADMREVVSSFCLPKERCNFTKANWSRACIQQCNFFDCDFTKSSFSKTTIVAAHFIRCNFTDAKLKGVNAPEAYVKNSIRPSGKRARCWWLQPATPNPS
jgi:2-iminobutanoate/2-iminopropanoate deaminase